MYYLIRDTLEECTLEDCRRREAPYVAVLTTEEWQAERADFDMGIDLEPDTSHIRISIPDFAEFFCCF